MHKIWEPVTIGHLTLKNRLVMPPMRTGKATVDGQVTEALCQYYAERAKYSKVGLIIVEHCYINKQGKASEAQLAIDSDETIAGLEKLTDTIHAENVPVFAQLNHAGSMAMTEVTGEKVVGPSPVVHTRRQKEQIVPVALTAEQIHELTACFAQAALRAKRAGFDGVEIHSAHGYLLNQFYSPLSNQRADEYGPQTVGNRVRFQVEVLRAVRTAVGADYPVVIRLGGCDYIEGGSTVEDCAQACRLLQQAGADLIDLSGGALGYVRPSRQEPGYFKDMSLAAREAVSVPVLLTGGVGTLDEAEDLLAESCADLIGVGRAIFKNAHWADSEEQK